VGFPDVSETITATIAAVQSSLGYWSPTVGTSNEPAITSANNVQQVMLAPPFKWSWNRNSLTFNTVAGTQDYTSSVTDFGYAETATIAYPGNSRIVSLNVLNHTPLGESIDQQVPATIGVQQNTVGTSVKFRFLGVPDKIYAVVVWYQKFSPKISALSDTWVPPDFMGYIYQRGFLAELYEAFAQPSLAAQQRASFAAGLIANSEGLTLTEKNMFLAQYLGNMRMLQDSQLSTQVGTQARSAG
jgi:hypothetical protein